MDWILRNLPLLIILIVAFNIVRAVMAAKKQQESNKAGEQDELEQQRRIREIQEQIRRKIAERRGESPPPVIGHRETHPARTEPPPAIPPVDPFGGGGTLKRALQEIERRLQPVAPPVLTTSRAEVERQVQLAEQLRLAEETKHQLARRAAHAAAARAEVARSEDALRETARQALLSDLADPQSLRRAFVLREVLGPPVGLR